MRVTTPGHAESPPVAAIPRRVPAELSTATERFTQRRVERILSLVVALGSGVLGAQSFLNALGSTQETLHWHAPLLIGVFVPLGLMVIALASGVLVRLASGVCAVAIAAALLSWPAATSGSTSPATSDPWIWYLLNVATAAAAMAFPLAVQIGWVVFIPVLYTASRLWQVGLDRASVVEVVLDSSFALILGGVIVALGWILRSVAVGIDDARRDAVRSYAAAAEADAAEAERVAVAALMHDSVLAALIAAERAETPREDALAVAMAREALTRLANAELDAGEGSDESVAATALARAVENAAATGAGRVPVTVAVEADAGEIPGRVARAIVLATTQAVANAIQHAGGRGLAVDVRAGRRAVAVRIADRGAGFEPAAVGADRLGIRGSIVARMAAVGGRARVATGRQGTTVILEWERPR